MPRSLRPQPDHFALAALAVLAVVFWGNCLWGGKVPVAAVYQKQMLPWSAVSQAGGETRQWDSLLWDSMAQFYPWRLLLHNAAKQGELPLWNPYQFCGYPFVGNGQSAMFYPPNWLYFVLHPKLGMGLSAALHYFLGSLFVFGLARRWRLGPIPATFAAVAFTYGGFMVTWIELPTLVNSLVWLPLAWWGIEVIVRPGRSEGRAVPGRLVSAVSRRLEGPYPEPHPASGPLSVASPPLCHPERSEGPCREAVGVRGEVLRYAQDDNGEVVFPPARPLRETLRGLIMLATALGLTLLAGHFQIAAYVWIFAALYAIIRVLGLAVARDARRTRRLLAATGLAVALASMLSMTQLLPTLELGGLSARGAGKPSAAGFEFHRQRAVQPMELLGLLQADFLGTPVDGSYKGISYSEHCPYVGATTILLGLVGLAAGWRRRHLWLFAGLATFALWGAMAGPPAMLLYWGVPKLGQAGGFSRLLSVWTLAAALWGGAGLQVLLDRLRQAVPSSVGRGLVPRRLPRPQDGRPQAPQPGASAPENSVSSDPASAGRSAAGPIAVALLALFLLAAEMLPWAYRFNPRADAADVYPETEAIRKLRELTGSDRYVALNDRRAWGLASVPAGVVLPPNAATVYGIRCVDGYDSLFPAAYRAFAAKMEKADPSPLANGNMLLMEKGLPWESYGAAYVVAPAGGQEPGRNVSQSDGLGLWQTSSPSAGLSWRGYQCIPEGQLVIQDDGINHVRLDVSGASQIPTFPPAPGRVLVVLFASYYPGWQCSVDGRPEAIQPHEGVFRAITPAYKSRIADFVYYPASVAVGLFVTLLALAALAALGTAGLWRWRA